MDIAADLRFEAGNQLRQVRGRMLEGFNTKSVLPVRLPLTSKTSIWTSAGSAFTLRKVSPVINPMPSATCEKTKSVIGGLCSWTEERKRWGVRVRIAKSHIADHARDVTVDPEPPNEIRRQVRNVWPSLDHPRAACVLARAIAGGAPAEEGAPVEGGILTFAAWSVGLISVISDVYPAASASWAPKSENGICLALSGAAIAFRPPNAFSFPKCS